MVFCFLLKNTQLGRREAVGGLAIHRTSSDVRKYAQAACTGRRLTRSCMCWGWCIDVPSLWTRPCSPGERWTCCMNCIWRLGTSLRIRSILTIRPHALRCSVQHKVCRSTCPSAKCWRGRISSKSVFLLQRALHVKAEPVHRRLAEGPTMGYVCEHGQIELER